MCLSASCEYAPCARSALIDNNLFWSVRLGFGLITVTAIVYVSVALRIPPDSFDIRVGQDDDDGAGRPPVPRIE